MKIKKLAKILTDINLTNAEVTIEKYDKNHQYFGHTNYFTQEEGSDIVVLRHKYCDREALEHEQQHFLEMVIGFTEDGSFRKTGKGWTSTLDNKYKLISMISSDWASFRGRLIWKNEVPKAYITI